MLNNSSNTIYYIVCFLFVINFSSAQNSAPVLTSTGNQAYCPLSEINIVTDFDIFDPDDTEIEALFIQISTGYVSGEDILTLTGTHPNIIVSWRVLEGKLTLKGTAALVSYVDLIAAVKDIVFQSASNTPSGKKFSITIGDANYLPSTGHYYEYVPLLGITWTDAKVAAETRTYFGLSGYLATVTSAEEAQLVGEQAAGAGWIGGTDAETEGVWKWVTGPEAGTIFWNGQVNGSTPNYAKWNDNEPNDMNGEDYAHITDPSIGIPGAWNDLKVEGDPPGDYHPKGYVVEYGGMPGDPTLNISTSTSIFPIIKVTPLSSDITLKECDDILDGNDTNGYTVFNLMLNETNLLNGSQVSDFIFQYFTDAAYSIPIITPNAFVNTIQSGQTVYVRIVSSLDASCYTDTSFDIIVEALPVIQSTIVFKNCDEDGNTDGFTDFNLEEAYGSITNNSAEQFDVSFYLNVNDANLGNTATLNNPMRFNNTIANTVFARVENEAGCYRVSTISLQVSTTSFQGAVVEIVLCDDDDTADGYREFDLSQASILLLDQFPSGQNLSVHYYTNLDDARLEQNEILNVTTYENSIPFGELLYVRVESDDNGDCFGIGPHLSLVVNPRPEFEVDSSETYCSDNVPITLSIENPDGIYTYEWRDENGQIVGGLPVIEVVTGGDYSVVATSSDNCVSFPVTFSVVASVMAAIDIDDITIVELTDNNSIAINNTNSNLGIGDYEFALDDINGPYQDQPYFDRVGAGTHFIYVKDKYECGISELEVFILGFSKFFTPNGDGDNDYWSVNGIGDRFANSSVVNLFDRYGKLIKQINAKNGAWDGTFNGQELADSDYWFVAQLVEISGTIRTYRGHFSLIR